jgi:hypothetical protein
VTARRGRTASRSERIYTIVARNIVVDRTTLRKRFRRESLNAAQADILTHAACDLAKQGNEAELFDEHVLVARSSVRVNADRIAEVRQRLSEVFQSLTALDGQGSACVEILVASFPINDC